MFKSNTKRLTDYEYNSAVIKRISGNTYKSIAESIDGETPKYLQKLISNAVELDTFTTKDSVLSINSINDEVTALVFPGWCKIDNLEITNDLADGVLICSKLVTPGDNFNLYSNDFSIDDELSLRVGFVIETFSCDSTHEHIIGFIKHLRYLTQRPDELLPEVLSYSGFTTNDINNFVWSDTNKTGTRENTKEIVYLDAIEDEDEYEDQPEPQYTDPTPTSAQPKQYTWQGSNKALLIDDGDETFSCDSTHEHFSDALKLAIEGLFEEAIALINVRKAVQEYTSGYVTIKDGVLTYKGIPIYSGIATRIIESMKLGEDFEYYIPFFEKLMENPSRRAVLRLFDFLVANDIEINDQGDIIAWKVITHDWKDCHTRTFDNSITGIPVEMPRNLVNDDDNITCSDGLHVCSKSYIGSFKSGSNRVVKVSVNPKDVVSIPVDYNDAKMRVCSYIVLEEVME